MKGFLGICFFGLIAVSSFASAQVNDSPMSADAAYARIKNMVGGVWHTKVGNTDVESRWTCGPDGTSVMADTVVDPRGPNPVHLMARFGWDKAAKQIYYLDAHGVDVVYFGHLVKDGNDLVINFKGIVGDPNAYVFRLTFSGDDAFHATLRTAGKQEKEVETFDWSRTQD